MADTNESERLKGSPGSNVTTDHLLQEVEEYFSLGARVRPGDTVVDVGANIGAFALRVAKSCAGDVRLLEFEPSPDTFAALSENFERNPLLHKTRHSLFHVGLSSGEHAGQMLSFYDFSRFPTNNTFNLHEKRREFEIYFEVHGQRIGARIESALKSGVGRGIGRFVASAISSLPKGRVGWWAARTIMGLREHSIRVDTLPRMITAENVERIDLLKIDVEGLEWEVLRGLDEPTWRKIQQVVVETTRDHDGRLGEIEAQFRAHGLTEIRSATQKVVDNGLEQILIFASRTPPV